MLKGLGKLVKGVLIAFGALLVIALAFGYSGSNKQEDFSSDQGKVSVEATADEGATQAEEEAPAEEAAPAEKYSVTGEELDASSPYAVYITGILTNNTDKDLSYLQVEYNLYDSEGNQVGTALDNTNNLKAGGTWKFKAVSLDQADDIASFELAGVSGW